MSTKKVVLIMEDEMPLQEAIKKKMELSGFSVVTARNVAQAFNYLEELEKIDVIWLDHYLLGKENGLDFVSRVKADGSKYKDIPIFVVSNTASPEKVGAYVNLGVNKYYTKADYRLEEIIKDISTYLEKGE